MRSIRRPKLVKRLSVLAALLLAGLSVVFAFIPSASAFDAYGKPTYDAGGYTAWRSYFKDFAPVGVAGWDVLPRRAAYGDNSMPVITDPASFVNFLRDNYNEAINSDTQDTTGDTNVGWRKTGAAFIGWTMLGVSPGNMGPSGTPGSRETSPDWNELLNRLNGLNAAGKISWNVPVSTADYGGVNTRYLSAPYDDVQAVTIPASVGPGIIFHDYSNNIAYVIRYNCANPLGAFPGLPTRPAPQWSVTASASVNTANAYPGQPVTFSFNIHNNGPDAAPLTQYGIRYQLYSGSTPQGIGSVPPDGSATVAAGSDIPDHRTWNFTVPATYNGTKACAWISYLPTSSSNGGWSDSAQACVTVTQPVATCNGASVTPSSGIDPTTTFVVMASVKYQDQPAAASAYGSGTRLYATVTGPGGYNQDSLNSMDGGPPIASDLTANSRVFPATGNTGIYTVTYGARGGIGTINTCTITFQVGYYPFFRVEGADAVAGAGIADTSGSCTADNTAFIRGSNKGSSGNYFGSGAQLGAIALSTIGASVAFPTSTNKDGTVSGVASGNRTGLTFANTSTPGGNFGALPCVKDYAGVAATTAGATTSGGGSVSPASLADGTYIYTGSVTLSGGTIPAGRHVTIVVNGGDAVINSNVLYGSYATMAEAPQFQLLVKNGSIRVAPTVTELHGAYVAEPGGTSGSGTLSTCYNGADTTDYTTCKSKLTFYGAVVAKTVLLERTYGNLNVSGATPADGAEVFQYTPELWAARNNPSGAGAQRYDSITSLPPIL